VWGREIAAVRGHPKSDFYNVLNPTSNLRIGGAVA
jgi:hypothetical protein